MNRPARWVLILLPALALGATITWWSLRRSEPVAVARPNSLEVAAATAAKKDARAGEVLTLIRQKGPDARTKLVELYGRFAGDASAVGLRVLALNALFAEPALPLRLKSVLEAVVADQTPPREDPLWPEIVQKLSDQWSPDLFDRGRDLMLMEKRPRARRALVDSFVQYVESGQVAGLSQEQGSALMTDLIDMHPNADADQRPAIEGAVRKIGGNDPADLLAGIGLKEGQKLELQAEYERQLQAGVDSLMKDQPRAE